MTGVQPSASAPCDGEPVSRRRSAEARVAGERLRATACTAAVGGGLVVVKLFTGWGVVCPFRALTGWRCPLCGATTMGADLVRGRFADAWRQNQFCFVGLAGLLGCCAWWLGLWSGAVRPRGGSMASGRSLRAPSQDAGYVVALVVAVVWVLVRNLVPALRVS